ncbi:hypothetical protein QEZ54_09830 [Catellatospora sp. KI3]|uniref:hypothetical protein n=1 Tax=Catellatospora sp. KI3 TaxID=3041620 RepID=UPI002482ABA0|nr:hypothetical protein [Catellatospora sp. KI3]MDI1461266.1 hypothetical protein [Catellatospora sp. KI3]
MEFEARALRVQLPCQSVTVFDADGEDARLDVHRYWQAVAAGLVGGVDLGGMCDDCSANPSEPLCTNASEDMDPFAFIDYRVLPVLRRQLEARLNEIAQAEQAVARAVGNG